MSTSPHLDVGGTWVPIITPFDDASAIDHLSLSHLADRLLNDGVDGLVALGTTGEPATLDAVERRQVVETCAAACAQGDRRLMVGAGTNSTSGTIDEVLRLTDGLDVDAVLIVAPYYTRPSAEAIVEHFGLVADASPVPVVIYNIPYRTGRGLDADCLLRAGSHPNIVGVKQSVAGVDVDTLEVLRVPDPQFQVLAGDDAFITPTVLLGGSGAIAAAAHLCTTQFVEMTRAALVGDAERATEMARVLLPVVTAGFAEPSPAVWKAALAERGELTTPKVRRPMTEASAEATAILLAAADHA